MDEKKNEEIEIVMGGETDLEFSDVKDSINTLRPKDKEKKKNIIIPKSTQLDDSNKEETEEENM